MFKQYAVTTGVNASHLHDVKWFERLKDARQYIEDLPLGPVMELSYTLESYTYQSDKDLYYSSSKLIEERLIA